MQWLEAIYREGWLSSMKISYQPDDFEPLDADERCDSAFGHYHIGREDESRSEIALLFDANWLPNPTFLSDGLWSVVNRHDGRLISSGELPSESPHLEAIVELIRANVRVPRALQIQGSADVSAVIVELSRHAIPDVDKALGIYTAYLGWGDVSYPSPFRTAINEGQQYV